MKGVPRIVTAIDRLSRLHSPIVTRVGVTKVEYIRIAKYLGDKPMTIRRDFEYGEYIGVLYGTGVEAAEAIHLTDADLL